MAVTARPRKRRVMYNVDENSIIYLPHLYPMSLDQYYDCVDQLLGTQVDTYVQCISATTHREAGGEVQRPYIGSRSSRWREAWNWRHVEGLGKMMVWLMGCKDS